MDFHQFEYVMSNLIVAVFPYLVMLQKLFEHKTHSCLCFKHQHWDHFVYRVVKTNVFVIIKRN